MPKNNIKFISDVLNEYVDNIEKAQEALDNIDIDNKYLFTSEVKTKETVLMMRLMMEYRRYLDGLDDEMKSMVFEQNVNMLTDLIKEAEGIKEEPDLEEYDLYKKEITNDIDTSADKARLLLTSNSDAFLKDKEFYPLIAKGLLGPMMYVVTTTIGENERIIKDAKGEKPFSKELQDIVKAANVEKIDPEVKNEEKKEEVKEDIVKSPSQQYVDEYEAIKDNLNKVNYNTKFIDESTVKSNLGSIMMDLMRNYSKLDLSDEQKKKNIETLSKSMEKKNNYQGLSEAIARQILRSPYSVIVEDKEFIKYNVANNVPEIIDFYKGALGENVVDDIVKKTDIPQMTNEYKTAVENLKKEEIKKEEKVEDIEIDNDLKDDIIDTSSKQNEIKISYYDSKESFKNVEKLVQEQLKAKKAEKFGPIFKDLITENEIKELEEELENKKFLATQNPNIEGNRAEDLKKLSDNIETSKRLLNAVKADRKVFEAKFGKLNPAEPEFKQIVEGTIASIAKGDEPFTLSIYSQEPLNNYVNATRFVKDILNVKYPLFEMGDIEEVSDRIFEKYENVSLADVKAEMNDLRAEINGKNKLEEFYQGCTTPEQRKERFSTFVDDVLEGRKIIPELNGDRPRNNLIGLGRIANYYASLLNDAKYSSETYGITSEQLREVCDSKLDGSLAAAEYENLFYSSLGKKPYDKLTNEEKRAINGFELDHNDTPAYQAAKNKMNFVKADKSSPLLNDALGAYARLADMHNSRPWYYYIAHPFKKFDEWSAYKNCENVLKNNYHFTDNELQDIRNDYKKYSIDAINLSAMKAKNKEEFSNFLKGSDERDKLIADTQNEPLLKARNIEKKRLESQKIDFNKEDKLIENDRNSISKKVENPSIKIDSQEKKLDI